jgi:hypothetical protein
VQRAVARASSGQVDTSDSREPTLSPEFQARLAEQFAPRFVFHRSEEYFPVSPLFLIEGNMAAEPGSDPDVRALLDTPESRGDRYRSLTRVEKAELATVYYRAYPIRSDKGDRIVLEYWLYYVENDYRVRGNLLPFWFDGSHPNDLEHIHLSLRALPDTLQLAGSLSDGSAEGFVVDEVYASAHEGSIPANRYQYPEEGYAGNVQILVELGSHAMAPDIDGDGLFMPGTDGDSGNKILWGIRDRGITWVPYNSDYMDARAEDAVVLEGPRAGEDPRAPDDRSYRLVPVETVQAQFRQLSLSESQREYAFEEDMHWFRRVFGGNNGSSESLLAPPPAAIDSSTIGVDGASSIERGVFLGAAISVGEPAAFLGGRYSFLLAPRYLPDIVFEADGTLTGDGGYIGSRFLLSYPMDGSTRFFGGTELLADSISFRSRQWAWVGAVEARLGRMRVRLILRSDGPVARLPKELRLAYFF